MESLPKPKKSIADFSFGNTDDLRGGRINWKFQSYKGAKLGYDMICESINSEQEEKEGDVLNGNRIINLKNFITNMEFFWCAKSVHRRGNYR